MKLILLLLLGVAAASARPGPGLEVAMSENMYLSHCLGKNFTEMSLAAAKKCRDVGLPPSWEDLEGVQELLEAILKGNDGDQEDEFGHGFPGEMVGGNKNFNLDLSVSFPGKILLQLLKMKMKMMMGGDRRRMGPRGRRPEMEPYYERGYGYDSSEEYGSRGDKMSRMISGLMQSMMGGKRDKWDGPSDERHFKMRKTYGKMGGSDDDALTSIFNKFLAPTAVQGLRNKRQAGDDEAESEISQEYFIDKLKTIQMILKEMSTEGSCVWKELNIVNDMGSLNDLETIIKAIDNFGIEDEEIGGQLKQVATSCQQSAMVLPRQRKFLFLVNEEFARALAFNTCVEDSMDAVCRQHGTQKQFEEAFGPLSTLVEETGLDREAILAITELLL